MWGSRGRGPRSQRVDTVIGKQTRVRGDVTFRGGLHCDGHVEGDVMAEDDDHSQLTLSRSASIVGNVRAPYVRIDGVVNGDVHASRRIELAANARITGDVFYTLLEMAVGAEVNGKLQHVGPEARPPLALAHGHTEGRRRAMEVGRPGALPAADTDDPNAR